MFVDIMVYKAGERYACRHHDELIVGSYSGIIFQSRLLFV